MQEGLLLVPQLETDQETRSLNQVVSVILSRTLDNLLVILQLIGLQDVTSFVVIEGVIVQRLLLISIRVILERAHAVRGHRTFIHAPESLKT